MRLGFVGTGTIARAAVTGFCTAECPIAEIWLSPRSVDTAAELAGAYAKVRVADSNQSVLDRCEVIIISVRPQVAREILTALTFRRDHRVISLVAGFSHGILAPLVSPASNIVRAVPLPAIAMRLGPTAIYPPDDTARALFGQIGTAVEVTTEEEFDALLAVTAEMASFFDLLRTCADWLAQNGVLEHSAKQYVAAMFQALTATAVSDKRASFNAMVHEHMTKGGLNEQLHRQLGQAGVFDEHRHALAAILARIRGAH
jgi:pyrroline-5-carboxylate reductase